MIVRNRAGHAMTACAQNAVARSDARHGEQFSEIKSMLEKISDRLNDLSMRERRDL